MPRRPPKCWWIKIIPKIKKEYPSYTKKRLNQIVGGIWKNYSTKTKNRIRKECEL